MKAAVITDGIKSLYNMLANSRNALSNNVIDAGVRLDDVQARAMFRTGLGSKIVRIKAGYSLKDTIQFANDEEEEYYKENLEEVVKKAARFMLGFGRGIIVVHRKGDNLSKPFNPSSNLKICLKVFSGDMVTCHDEVRDIDDDRYMLPQKYDVNGTEIHHSRVVDFRYVEVVEQDLATYNFGGVSEFELIHTQFINDGIVERASANIIEKNSSFFYKLKGYKDAIRANKEDDIKYYVEMSENVRGIHGAGIIDADDEVKTVTQALTNLDSVDNITLRRLAMVTGIPLSILVGENVKGLNSTGDNEMKVFQDTIETMQSEYLKRPINQLLKMMKREKIKFKENQGETALTRVNYEKTAIENAEKIFRMNGDHEKYLSDRGVVKESDSYDKLFKEAEDEEIEV